MVTRWSPERAGRLPQAQVGGGKTEMEEGTRVPRRDQKIREPRGVPAGKGTETRAGGGGRRSRCGEGREQVRSGPGRK